MQHFVVLGVPNRVLWCHEAGCWILTSLRKSLIHLNADCSAHSGTIGIGPAGRVRTTFEAIRRFEMTEVFRRLWSEEEGQDIAEYAVMLAVILVIVVGTIRLIGTNANNVFSSVASSIQ